jgi:hypothetical protein
VRLVASIGAALTLSPRRDRLLRAVFLTLMAVYGLYNFSTWYAPNPAYFPQTPELPYRAVGFMALEPFRSLGVSVLYARGIHALYVCACVLAAFDRRPMIVRPLAGAAGLLYFGLMDSYMQESNIEFIAALLLLAFSLPPDPRNRRAESSAAVLGLTCLSLLYLNSAVTHALNWERWADGIPLKTTMLFLLNHHAYWTPWAQLGTREAVAAVPPDIFRVLGVGSIALEGTFWVTMLLGCSTARRCSSSTPASHSR